MKNIQKSFLLVFIVLIQESVAITQNVDYLKLDPSLLISLKECRNITDNIKFYPEWDFNKIPVLFYRPGVQEILINYPKKPLGYKEFKGKVILGDEMIYYRNDSTFTLYDDQNTTIEIDGIPVLVVADPWSRMRNQIRGTVMNQSDEFINDWLDKWNFIQTPYDEIRLILHEGFHIYQEKMSPDKYANEMNVSEYPLLNPVNNSLYVLEGNILKDILLTEMADKRMEKIKEFVAVRTYRQSLLDQEIVEYENRNEFVEGTAKYIEYKLLQMADAVKPLNEMYYQNGFAGYKDVLPELFTKEIEDMVKIVSVSDNRFGNKYGTGPMRFRLYSLGACQALLLDELMPEWKMSIFNDNIYLCDLLKNAVGLSEDESKKYLNLAKSEYSYDQVLKDKIVFEKEGKKIIKEKTDAILNTENTLVTINYKDFTEDIRMYFTPFGVTKISATANIYDMIPITIRFKKGVVLKMNKVIPVIIDKEKKEVTFAINSNNLKSGDIESIDLDEFSLAGTKLNIENDGNHINICLMN